MKTILFFDRLNLTKLFGELDYIHGNEYNIIHIAYSNQEEELLVTRYGVDRNRIINFKKEFVSIFNSKKIVDEVQLNKIETDTLEQTNKRFCINSLMQSDRAMKYKTYNENLIIIQICYDFWEKIFKKYKPIFIFHESVSLCINAIASILARKNNCIYAGFYQTYGINEINFTFDTFDSGSPVFLDEALKVDRRKCEIFLFDFRRKINGPMFGDSIIYKQPSLLGYYFRSKKRILSKHIKKNIYSNKLEDYVDNFLFLSDDATNHYVNLSEYKKIKWDTFNKNLNYYYYPLHLEPEASVYYGGDGLYENQIKLVQNIAGQLPPNCWLYVKDHPHDIGYRCIEDYKKLQNVPNIKLLPANFPGQEIIRNSIGVITLNGTTGFEALLMQKPVFYFGKPPYAHCKGAFYVKNVKDFRYILDKNREFQCNDDDIIDFLQQWFYWSFPGNITYFVSSIDSDEENKKIVINSFKTFLDRF